MCGFVKKKSFILEIGLLLLTLNTIATSQDQLMENTAHGSLLFHSVYSYKLERYLFAAACVCKRTANAYRAS